jgi:hypothetical protein
MLAGQLRRSAAVLSEVFSELGRLANTSVPAVLMAAIGASFAGQAYMVVFSMPAQRPVPAVAEYWPQ